MKLKTGQKCAFGFGAFGKDIVYMLISSYLLYYYNVVLGMSSVFIGTVMMAARIFDAFNDPVMGIIVAKTRTGWGRFRPWIFAGTVLNAVTIYALYATPESMGDSAQRVWLTVFYFAWGICCSCFCSTGACHDGYTAASQEIQQKPAFYIRIYYSDSRLCGDTYHGICKALHAAELVHTLPAGYFDLSGLWYAQCYHDYISFGFC